MRVTLDEILNFSCLLAAKLASRQKGDRAYGLLRNFMQVSITIREMVDPRSHEIFRKKHWHMLFIDAA
jgi:hypothetical protein